MGDKKISKKKSPQRKARASKGAAGKAGSRRNGVSPAERSSNDQREDIRVQTVFISSRMEEVVAERKAAYEAVFSQGLVPLMFEAAPDLGAADKARIDTLVDNADLFIGVYDRSLGDSYIGGHEHLTPIEYELYRFVLAADLKRKDLWSGEGLEEVLAADLAKDSDKIRELRKGRLSQYDDILRKRVRLYLRPNGVMEKDLVAFLNPYFVRVLKYEPLPARKESKNAHFLPPPVVLYDRIRKDIEEGVVEQVFLPTDVGASGYRIGVSVKNEPGCLERVLEEVFERGLNILSIHDMPGDAEHRVTVLARTFGSASSASKPEVLESLLHQRSGLEYSVSRVARLDEDVDESFDIEAGASPDKSTHIVRLRTLCAPGILSTVVSRISRRDLNIDFVCQLQRDGSPLVPEQEFCLYLTCDGRERDCLHLVDYELSGIVGVLSAGVGVTDRGVLHPQRRRKAKSTRRGKSGGGKKGGGAKGP